MRSPPQKVSKGKKDLWSIGDESWDGILDHSLGDYPKEACGILLCPRQRPQFIIASHPARNATSEDPTARYLLDPKEVLAVYTWAEKSDLDICGFYHSHPDQPSVPSEYDGKFAWEGYLYLILSINNGVFKDLGAWTWDVAEERFNEVFSSGIRDGLLCHGSLRRTTA
jgi:proteasome lid subunit RPN8/RPN11